MRRATALWALVAAIMLPSGVTVQGGGGLQACPARTGGILPSGGERPEPMLRVMRLRGAGDAPIGAGGLPPAAPAAPSETPDGVQGLGGKQEGAIHNKSDKISLSLTPEMVAARAMSPARGKSPRAKSPRLHSPMSFKAGLQRSLSPTKMSAREAAKALRSYSPPVSSQPVDEDSSSTRPLSEEFPRADKILESEAKKAQAARIARELAEMEADAYSQMSFTSSVQAQAPHAPEGNAAAPHSTPAKERVDGVENYMDSEDLDDAPKAGGGGEHIKGPESRAGWQWQDDEWDDDEEPYDLFSGGQYRVGMQGDGMPDQQALDDSGFFGNVTAEGAASVFMMRGRREYMEDNWAVYCPYKGSTNGVPDKGGRQREGEVPGLFGVFDGHGGSSCSQYCRDHLIPRCLEFIEGPNEKPEGRGDSVAPPGGEAAGGEAGGAQAAAGGAVLGGAAPPAAGEAPPGAAAVVEGEPQAAAEAAPEAEGAKKEEGGGGGGEAAVPQLSSKWLKKALQYAFTQTDREVVQSYVKMQDGSTSVVVAVTSRYIMCANAGDSRAVLLDGDTVVALSRDHKPSRRDELERIESLGGLVLHLGVPRVNGILAVSRAIGDAELKKYVISDPEIRAVLRSKTQRFVVLATDGLWDVFTNDEAVQFIEEHWEEEGHGSKALAQEAYNRGSFDNVCVMVVDLLGGQGLAPLVPHAGEDSSELSDNAFPDGSSTSLQDETHEEAVLRASNPGLGDGNFMSHPPPRMSDFA